MSLLATLPAAIVETILTRLAALFMAGARGDAAAARDAAVHMVNAYRPETEDELRLAANVIASSFQALEVLSQAAAQDLPLTRALRLCSVGVSLNREAAKAERRLSQLQKARRQPVNATETRENPPQTARVEPTGRSVPAATKDHGAVSAMAKTKKLTWTQAYEQRQRDRRLAANAQKAAARSIAPIAAEQRSAGSGFALTTPNI